MLLRQLRNVARMPIYTRTGDQGTSSLLGGIRQPKTAPFFDALGATDELSSHIGVAMAHCRTAPPLAGIHDELLHIQCFLQELSSNLATPRDLAPVNIIERTKFDAGYVAELEGWIDAHDKHLPDLKNFVLPSGNLPCASLHTARAVCRRTERQIVGLASTSPLEPAVLQFINRDYLFTAARRTCLALGDEEVIYLTATQRREKQLKKRTHDAKSN